MVCGRQKPGYISLESSRQNWDEVLKDSHEDKCKRHKNQRSLWKEKKSVLNAELGQKDKEKGINANLVSIANDKQEGTG